MCCCRCFSISSDNLDHPLCLGFSRSYLCSTKCVRQDCIVMGRISDICQKIRAFACAIFSSSRDLMADYLELSSQDLRQGAFLHRGSCATLSCTHQLRFACRGPGLLHFPSPYRVHFTNFSLFGSSISTICPSLAVLRSPAGPLLPMQPHLVNKATTGCDLLIMFQVVSQAPEWSW
jgi:hypothetical protein